MCDMLCIAENKDNLMEKNQKLTPRAREMRKSQTKEENLLWYRFLRKYPHRFRRQYVIGNYIADFFCHRAKLVVELDGSQHYSSQEMDYDAKRTSYLESKGLKVLRFSNRDLLRQFDAVCAAIDQTVKEQIESNETVLKP